MSINTVKLQVPINQDVRDGLERRALELGFDSAQAYIRVWAKAEVDGRELDFGHKALALSPEADDRYTRMVADLDSESRSGKAKTFSTVDEFMRDLE